MKTKQVFFAGNRDTNTAAIFEASCFEELQGMFRVGIGLPDGTSANMIGRCKSEADFQKRAARGGTRVQTYADETNSVLIPG